jgi:hypothetical protein
VLAGELAGLTEAEGPVRGDGVEAGIHGDPPLLDEAQSVGKSELPELPANTFALMLGADEQVEEMGLVNSSRKAMKPSIEPSDSATQYPKRSDAKLRA